MPIGVRMARSAKTKRRLLQKRWERRVVKRVTDRLLGVPGVPEFARVPIRANAFGEALNDGLLASMSYNLYASRSRMSAVVYGISGV